MNLVQAYKLIVLQLCRLPTWKGDWTMPGMDRRTELVSKRWSLLSRMTWSERDEVRAWEAGRKVATS